MPHLRQGDVMGCLILLFFAFKDIPNVVGKGLSVLNAVVIHIARTTINFIIIITCLIVVAVIAFLLARSQSERNNGNDEKLFHSF